MLQTIFKHVQVLSLAQAMASVWVILRMFANVRQDGRVLIVAKESAHQTYPGSLNRLPTT